MVGYIKVIDVLTRSPHLSERWKSKYRQELRNRLRKEVSDNV